ncbi:MAG TPA: T9SS type A sorting domain-containing protein, partial [candidate division Zixibacteria bacterium]|nr:T9SS type A sorting domain-containing protein [candidate division Zixibacteria bacterium]
AFYRRALARYTPELFTYTSGGVRKPSPRFADVGMYDVVLFDGAGLSSPVTGNEFISRQSWLMDIARTGGVLVYVGSGFSFGYSPALPGLYTREFGETRTAHEVFGLDSTSLISRGSHMSVNSGDSLFRYFQPIGADPAPGSGFPSLDYGASGFYASDDFNTGPSPFKGVLYPRVDNTQVLYTYRSGRDPVSALEGEAVAVRYAPPSHTAYTFLLAPWEWGEFEVEAFFTELLGDFQTAAPDDPAPVLPAEFVLSQNHPNPFNPETTIDFALPRRAEVELSIYNVLGQRVTTLFSGEAAAGRHTVNWRADAYASGVYFYRLSAGETTLTRKMLLLK